MSNKPKCLMTSFILINCSRNSCAIKTDLLDFHKPAVTVMKTTHKKLKPKIITYRNYKSFSNGSVNIREVLH